MLIPYFTSYDIDEHGRITNVQSGEEIVQHATRRYKWVMLKSDVSGLKRQVNVHTVMAEAFLGPKPDGAVVHFKDDDSSNLELSNLEYTQRRDIAIASVPKALAKRKPKASSVNTKESRELIYATMLGMHEPTSMLSLSNKLKIPYTVVRYSMYHLMADGRVISTEGGYICNT